jgi:hypothetical protein
MTPLVVSYRNFAVSFDVAPHLVFNQKLTATTLEVIMANSHINMSQKATVGKGRSRNGGPGEASSSFQPRGFFEVEHWRHGLLMATYRFKNGITNEGKDHIFNVHFDAATPVTIWYMLLIDNANFTALNAADTYDDIDQAGNGWDEFKTYTDNANASNPNTRPIWNPDPASGQSISNGTQTIFDITGTATVKGLGIVGGTHCLTKATPLL